MIEKVAAVGRSSPTPACRFFGQELRRELYSFACNSQFKNSQSRDDVLARIERTQQLLIGTRIFSTEGFYQ